MSSREACERYARSQRQLPPARRDGRLNMHELIRLGTLAASSHNTQPWRVRFTDTGIRIQPDHSRRCAVVDPDDSHLFKSLGCMAQNIEVAAAAGGFETRLAFDGSAVALDFESAAQPRGSELYPALVERQCTKTAYDGKALASDTRRALESAGAGQGVRTVFVDDPAGMESIVEFVADGNGEQLSDRAFRKELAQWIRFNPRVALARKDGLAGHLTGQPALPQWLGPAVLNFVLTPRTQSDTDARHIRSSAAVVAFVAERDDAAAWVELGRAYERFALAATARGIRNAFINQPIEVRRLRPQLNAWLGLDSEQALLLIRVGHAAKAPFSLRRPVEAIIEPRGEG